MKQTQVIAELSANHKQDINIAKQTIRKAKDAGADAIKIQTYTPDTMTIQCDNQYFKITHGTIWDGVTLYQLYSAAYTPWEWHEELFDYAAKLSINIFSTPFDITSVDFLEKIGVDKYKIASFEITDIPLINYIASKGKPIIISTGIATLEEIEDAVNACREQGNDNITLLQCTSQYPADPSNANLLTMADLKKRFGVRIGLSDHTMGYEVATAAVALGAEIIEKHFILDRNIGGPDSSFSMTPDEFRLMVDKIRFTETILGEVTYDLTNEKKLSRVFTRSLFVVENVKRGDIVNEENVRSIRPGNGMPPKYNKDIIGKKFNRDVERGTPMSWDFIDN